MQDRRCPSKRIAGCRSSPGGLVAAWTDDLIPGKEQFSLGFPKSARYGYPATIFLDIVPPPATKRMSAAPRIGKHHVSEKFGTGGLLAPT